MNICPSHHNVGVQCVLHAENVLGCELTLDYLFGARVLLELYVSSGTWSTFDNPVFVMCGLYVDYK